jgi:hypothetical protein
MDYAVLRKGARLRRVIVDRYNTIEAGDRIGLRRRRRPSADLPSPTRESWSFPEAAGPTCGQREGFRATRKPGPASPARSSSRQMDEDPISSRLASHLACFSKPSRLADRRRDIRETGSLASACRPSLPPRNVVVEDQGHRIEGVRGLRLERFHRHSFAGCRVFLSISYISSALPWSAVIKRDAAERVDDRQDARQLQVHGLDGHRGGTKTASMADHVAIGEVAAQASCTGHFSGRRSSRRQSRPLSSTAAARRAPRRWSLPGRFHRRICSSGYRSRNRSRGRTSAFPSRRTG